MSASIWTEDTARWAADRVRHHLPNLPEHMRGGVMAYLMDGREVGGFLTALFEGDKEHAIKKADPLNRAAWPHWLRLVDDYMPIASVGSREKAQRWRSQGGLKAYQAKPVPPEERGGGGDRWRDLPLTFGDLYDALDKTQNASDVLLMNIVERIGRHRAQEEEAPR